MAQNNIAPNFNNIAIATATLYTELPRLANLQGAQLNQAVLDRLDGIQNRLDGIQAELRRNSFVFLRLQNAQRYALNSRTTLLPLRSLRTRTSIPNCPTTVAQIRRLTRAEARRILQELELPVAGRLPTLRGVVRQLFFFFRFLFCFFFFCFFFFFF